MFGRHGQSCAQDLRERLLAAPGLLRKVAQRFGVSQTPASRVRSRRERLGQDSPRAQRRHEPPPPRRLAALAQLCHRMRVEYRVQVFVTATGKTWSRLGLAQTKDHSRA
jgi:transposase